MFSSMSDIQQRSFQQRRSRLHDPYVLTSLAPVAPSTWLLKMVFLFAEQKIDGQEQEFDKLMKNQVDFVVAVTVLNQQELYILEVNLL
ncbi:hypothetical protein HanPI659440_Chr17g0685101 [Helianthus annuus]|nr:hypothetical protein HanPI659440_Chr17g0685101 [Helianthus annuus]